MREKFATLASLANGEVLKIFRVEARGEIMNDREFHLVRVHRIDEK